MRNVKTTQTVERQRAMLWLNVGMKRPDGRFVSVPVGIPIDQIKLPEGDETWKRDQRALVEAILAKGSTLAGGERVALPTLTVELYKVPSEEDSSSNDVWVPEL